jgi:hypothetical protein
MTAGPSIAILDGANRPRCQKRRHHETDAFAGPGRRKAQHMLRSVVAEIVAIEASHQKKVGGR